MSACLSVEWQQADIVPFRPRRERTVTRHALRGQFQSVAMLMGLLMLGCGRGTPTTPVDRAEAAVEKFLDSWCRGEPDGKIAEARHQIQGSDPERKAGYRLLSFLNIEAKSIPNRPEHVQCRVALSLQSPQGTKEDREVIYEVETGAKTVISRVSP